MNTSKTIKPGSSAIELLEEVVGQNKNILGIQFKIFNPAQSNGNGKAFAWKDVMQAPEISDEIFWLDRLEILRGRINELAAAIDPEQAIAVTSKMITSTAGSSNYEHLGMVDLNCRPGPSSENNIKRLFTGFGSEVAIVRSGRSYHAYFMEPIPAGHCWDRFRGNILKLSISEDPIVSRAYVAHHMSIHGDDLSLRITAGAGKPIPKVIAMLS